MRRNLLVGGILLLTGCGPEDAGQHPAAPHLAITETTSFGSEEGEGALSAVFGVAESHDGRVFISEPQFSRVVEFGSDGSFVGILGRAGDGPGEFRFPGWLSWRGDTLGVLEFQRGISLFSPDGTFHDRISFQLPDPFSSFPVRPLFLLDDGSVAALAPVSPNAAIASGATRESWLKTSRDGTVLDTLAVISLRGRDYSIRHRGDARSGPHPLAWGSIVAAPPSGTSLVIAGRVPATNALAATYRVLRIGLEGDTTIQADVRYLPARVPQAAKDSIAEAIAESWSRRAEASISTLAAAVREQIDWPEYQPPITAVLAGSDGSIWVRREILGLTVVRWDILDEGLRHVGWVGLPPTLEVALVALDHFYGIELDEFDVPTVVRFDVGLTQRPRTRDPAPIGDSGALSATESFTSDNAGLPARPLVAWLRPP